MGAPYNDLAGDHAGVILLAPRRFGDARGWFMETWSAARAATQGIDVDFVQDNHSYSAALGTVRGLHFQTPPNGQAKLVRCLRGAIMDFVVDVRAGSPTYGRWVSAELSADNGYQLFIPVGFAHGFVTLQRDTEIAYKCSDVYAPASDGGVIWNDPDIGIHWPLPADGAVLSDKDRQLPRLVAFDSPFAYDGRPLAKLGDPV
ncbi:dTDP-4-dehydrorhamnose 3,5-epimerase [Brevundimonas sp. TWP2-3-2]|uniref:dTDP-4-dehydrorhamnose 3,5-epimerase n=1 Tax=unclassified Brevundimonas TaxID=2622653 RepID=UPI003CEA2A91